MRCRGTVVQTAILLSFLSTTAAGAADDGSPGAEIYRTQCAECHGAAGEGTEDFCPDPLQGDRSLDDLADVIADTMPEDDPDKCVGEDAKRVAEYIYDAFYSEAARAEQQSARIELTRLTTRQYDNAVADLIGSFVGEARIGKNRGLSAKYYNARNFRNDKKVFERTDREIAFDFGETSPDEEKIGVEEFAIQWQGTLIAEETGIYEIHLSTANGARVWVNDHETPLIDAWVKSGDDTEHTARLRLLGGRAYPLRVDYFKFKGKTASISLEWRPPYRARQVIPERNLTPDWVPQTFVITTPFPPDDSSVGYERGTSVSKAWEEATTLAAIETANKVVANLDSLAKTERDAPDRIEKLKDFCRRFAERAFRRPLSDAEQNFFVDAMFDDGVEPESAAKRVVLLTLKSPRFLYLGIENRNPDDYLIASRLSFGLWDSIPDAELLRAAGQGKLRTYEQVAAQARRMANDPRTKSKLRHFFHKWLKVDRIEEISKDKEIYPGFTNEIVSDLRTSLDLFVDDVVWSDTSDFRQLVLGEDVFVNRRLAEYYGAAQPSEPGFKRVRFESANNAGVLTHPFLMAGLAYHRSTSPIHRGVFLVRNMLGRSLKPPPIAVAPTDEGVDPTMTTRERVAQQTRPPACYTCHSLINPLGFSLEHLDAVGRYRAEEKNRPIDASGEYKSLAGELIEFNGARELAEFLAQSEEAQRCFAEQLFHHTVKQPITAYGADRSEELLLAFAQNTYNIQDLLLEIVTSSALEQD